MKINIRLLLVLSFSMVAMMLLGCINTGTLQDPDDVKSKEDENAPKNENKSRLNEEASKLYAQSLKFTKEGRYKEALEILWKIPTTSNLFDTACLNIIKLGIAVDDVYSVVYAAKLYVQIYPTDTEIMFTYAKYLARTKDGINKAEEILTKILTIKEDANSYELLAFIELEKNKFASAEQTLKQLEYVLSKNDKKLETKHEIWLARAKAGQNLTVEASKILKNILKKDPENHDALLVYLNILQDEQTWVNLVNEYLKKKPDDIEIIKLSGDFLHSKGNYKLASNFYEKATELNPDDLYYQRRLAECYMILGNFESAVSIFQRLRRYLPDDENLKTSLNAAFVSLINKLKQEQDWAKVERYLRFYSWTNPENQDLLFEIAETQEKRNQLLRARVTYETMIDRVDDVRRVYRGISRISVKLGDDETALESLEKIITLNPLKQDILEYVELANKYKLYNKSYDALKPVYLEIFKDKQYYEQYRDVTFKLLRTKELKDLLNGSQADWHDSDNTFKLTALKLCLAELRRLKDNEFSMTREKLEESQFIPHSVRFPNFSAGNKVIHSSQDMSGKDITKTNPSGKTYKSSDILQSLSLAETLLEMLNILEVNKETGEFWKLVVNAYKLMLRNDFAGTNDKVDPLIENFDYVLENKFQNGEDIELRKLRIKLILEAHKKGNFLRNQDSGEVFFEDITKVGWKKVLTVDIVLALTDYASHFPEMSLNAINYAIRCTYLVDSDTIELPKSWIQGDFTKIDTYRLPEICFAKLVQNSLTGEFYPDYYEKLQTQVIDAKSTEFYDEISEKLKNMLEFEQRKAARSIIFEILAQCQLSQDRNLAASFYLQNAVFELSTLDLKEYNQSINKHFEDKKFELYMQLGSIQVKIDKPEIALQYYRLILESRPEFAQIYSLIINALEKADRTSEIGNYLYMYLSNVQKSDDFKKWWAQLAEKIDYKGLLEEYKKGNFEILRIKLTQYLTNYPELYVLSFLLADCLESLGESWESEEVLDKTIELMKSKRQKGLIKPVVSYIYSSGNWQTLDELTELCDVLLADDPEYFIVKARVNTFNEEYSLAEYNIEKSEKMLEEHVLDDDYETLSSMWLLEKVRFTAKKVTPESAIALLNSLDVEDRLKIKTQLLSDNDFSSLWLSNTLYNLLRCNPEDFDRDLVTGERIRGEKYYEDDNKVHVKLLDGKYTIISKDKLVKE